MKLGNKLKKIKKIKPDSFKLTLEFDDGFVGEINLDPLFEQTKKPLISEILRGNLFDKCFIESGALAWPNGYELCPDSLRHWIKESRVILAA